MGFCLILVMVVFVVWVVVYCFDWFFLVCFGVVGGRIVFLG